MQQHFVFDKKNFQQRTLLNTLQNKIVVNSGNATITK